MNYNQYFENFQDLYENAVQAIIEMRESAEEIRNSMDAIIEACETIEGEL